MKSVSIPTAIFVHIASKRSSPADAPLSSALPSMTSADQVALIEIAMLRQPLSPPISTREALASATTTSHESVPAVSFIDLHNWSWPPGWEQRLIDNYVDGSYRIG